MKPNHNVFKSITNWDKYSPHTPEEKLAWLEKYRAKDREDSMRTASDLSDDLFEKWVNITWGDKNYWHFPVAVNEDGSYS